MRVGRPIPFEHLRLFLILAEDLHFGRASVRAGTSPASLSRRLRKLEQAVGATLVTRSTRRVELTPAGVELRDGARGAFRLLDGGVLAAQATPPASLTLDIPIGLPDPWFRAALRWAAAQSRPLRVIRHTLDVAVRDLRAGALDAAIVVGEVDAPGIPGDGVAEVIVDTEVVALIPEHHPAAASDVVAPGDLAGWPVVVLDEWAEDLRRRTAARLTGDPDNPYVVASIQGTITEGQLREARARGAVTAALALCIPDLDTSGFAVRRLDPPWTEPVSLVLRAGLDPGAFAGVTASVRAAIGDG